MARKRGSKDTERYEELLREARSLRGTSLWQDAVKRLRKNRAAMASLWFLVAMSLAAFMAPLLPLQSPVLQDLDNRQFQRPNFQPYRLTLTEQLKTFEFEIARLESEQRTANQERQAELVEEIAAKYAVEHPFQKLWHKPGPISWRLLQLRVMMFGDWCLPSLAGNDELGRDMLARTLFGARVSLTVGVLAALVSLVIGVSYGATAGYCGGLIDTVMMRIVDIGYSIPFIFVVIFLVTVLLNDEFKATLEAWGGDQVMIFYAVIGAISWLTVARVVRGQVISLKNEQFVDAARVIGAGTPRIVFRHLVPNVLGVVIVYLTLTIPAVMLFEAFLSFLGLGVAPPDVSWGLLANEGIKVITPLKIYWWLVFFPGLALSLTLFALNFLGDGLRDALDPHLKNK